MVLYIPKMKKTMPAVIKKKLLRPASDDTNFSRNRFLQSSPSDVNLNEFTGSFC